MWGGFEVYSTLDCRDTVHDVFTFDFIQQTLKDGHPIAIGWNDWGGHWQVIIGYDTMGTETTQDDVIIVADPYDTTDHNQDGYGIYAYVKQDLELARKVMADDDIVDDYFCAMKSAIIRLVAKKPDEGEFALDLLMIAKYLERIGDHCTNIAEWVEFSITGVHKSCQ